MVVYLKAIVKLQVGLVLSKPGLSIYNPFKIVVVIADHRHTISDTEGVVIPAPIATFHFNAHTPGPSELIDFLVLVPDTAKKGDTGGHGLIETESEAPAISTVTDTLYLVVPAHKSLVPMVPPVPTIEAIVPFQSPKLGMESQLCDEEGPLPQLIPVCISLTPAKGDIYKLQGNKPDPHPRPIVIGKRYGCRVDKPRREELCVLIVRRLVGVYIGGEIHFSQGEAKPSIKKLMLIPEFLEVDPLFILGITVYPPPTG
jgi:hypothetical protein